MKTRRAEPRDASAIAAVHLAGWNETYRGMLPDDFLDAMTLERRLELWRVRLADPARITYLAERDLGSDSEVVGFASGGPHQKPQPPYDAFLFSLYILRDQHRRGIGRALLALLASELLERGFHGMQLNVLSTNPARGFYERLRARHVTTVSSHHGGPWCDCVYGWPDLTVLRSTQ